MLDTFVPTSAGVPAAEDEAYLLVRAADELYALAGAALREVMRWRTPTPLPGAPPALLGILGQRGVVLPIVDLRLTLGLPAAALGRAARLVVVHHDGIDMALLVDAVLDLVPLAALGPLPAGPERGRLPLLAATARLEDRPLVVIDLAALIAVVQDGLRHG
jgi:purine-binding chemotaxis protein CheW